MHTKQMGKQASHMLPQDTCITCSHKTLHVVAKYRFYVNLEGQKFADCTDPGL